MTRIEFHALEYHADTSFHDAVYCYEGSPQRGWTVWRNQQLHLQLGPGYRLLQSRVCGVCSTDLARQHLPFPLPQVTGHEVVAEDEMGQRHVVEINASHHARGLSGCVFCDHGLPTHCPDRLVLGIHDLPGGFGAWMLVPARAALAVPDEISTNTALLIEPLAAALQAVTRVSPHNGDRIAVLGPRRLGMLTIAALAAQRKRLGLDFAIIAIARHQRLLELASELGANETFCLPPDVQPPSSAVADVVIDTTGTPVGLELAIRLAHREVHLKSTHGQPAVGLTHLTELVVDELAIDLLPDTPAAPRFNHSPDRPCRIAWMLNTEPPRWLTERTTIHRASGRPHCAADMLASFESSDSAGRLPRADCAVVGSAGQIDEVIRPRAGDESSLVRPRGELLVHPSTDPQGSSLLAAVVQGKLRLSSSRCGDFHQALAWMSADAGLSGLGDKLITHRFPVANLPQSFATARSAQCLKACVEHPPRNWP